MSKLIKGCEIVDSEWTLVEQGSELPLQAIAAGELVILPARLWLTNQDALRGKANVGTLARQPRRTRHSVCFSGS